MYEKIKKAISTTGFPLEHEISETLLKNGWQVICGKYYIDDISENAREIDIIAYRASESKKLESQVFTTLIISCKKNIDSSWVFMARDINRKDLNSNYTPIHYSTSDSRFGYLLRNDEQKYLFFDNININDSFFEISKDYFAYQEVSKNGKVKNDKNIYNSIVTAIKCQEYEKTSILERKCYENTIYQFNVVTVAETDIYEANFSADPNNPDIKKIDCLNFLSTHIINKKQLSCIVKIHTKNNFIEEIKTYNQVHINNVRYLRDELEVFYNHVDPTKILNIIWDRHRHDFCYLAEAYLQSNEESTIFQLSPHKPYVLDDHVIINITNPSEEDI